MHGVLRELSRSVVFLGIDGLAGAVEYTLSAVGYSLLELARCGRAHMAATGKCRLGHVTHVHVHRIEVWVRLWLVLVLCRLSVCPVCRPFRL